MGPNGPESVKASHRNREVMGSNPVEVLNFSGFSTQLQKISLITAKIIASLDILVTKISSNYTP